MSSDLFARGLEQWLPTVHKLARRYGGPAQFDDLVSEGTLALLVVLEKKGPDVDPFLPIRAAIIEAVRGQNVAGAKKTKNRSKIVYFREGEEEGFSIDHVRHTKPRDALMTVSLEWALCRLAPNQERVMRLYYLADLDQSEIADMLGVSQPMVSKALHTGLDSLRKLVFPEGYSEAKTTRLAPRPRTRPV